MSRFILHIIIKSFFCIFYGLTVILDTEVLFNAHVRGWEGRGWQGGG
jgi:hypothetical protein